MPAAEWLREETRREELNSLHLLSSVDRYVPKSRIEEGCTLDIHETKTGFLGTVMKDGMPVDHKTFNTKTEVREFIIRAHCVCAKCGEDLALSDTVCVPDNGFAYCWGCF